MHQPSTPQRAPLPEEAFAANMRAARERKRLSQRALAQRLADEGVVLDPSAITRIERGDRDVKLGEAYAIARALETTVGQLASGTAPDRMLNQLRMGADSYMEQARESLARMLQHLSEIQFLLRENPELVKRLVERDGEGPGSVDDYLPWVHRRLLRLARKWSTAAAYTAEDAEHLREIAAALAAGSVAYTEDEDFDVNRTPPV